MVEIHHCRIVDKVQRAHDRQQRMVRLKAAGECSNESMSTGGLYTLHHYLTHRTTRFKCKRSYNSQLLLQTAKHPSVRSHQSPPQHPHATLQVNLNLYPHSHRSPLTSIAPPRPVLPRTSSEALDSFHVRAIYAAIDVSCVRGDAGEDGEELTRVRRRLPPLPGPSLPGEELTMPEMKIL